MQLLYFCPYWGSKHLSLEGFAEKVKKAGYDGVEMWLPLEDSTKQSILAVLHDHDLALIGQHYQTHHANWNEHRKEYERHLRSLADARPLFINAHTGKDFFTFEQNAKLIDLADKIAQETGIRIVHETHRGRFSFAAHITKTFLEKIDSLYLTLDLSHWCNVAESLLEDQPEAVELALSRAGHLHARVGYAQGPQVSDPRAPEWQETVEQHIQWWKRALDYARKRGESVFTIAPECGPFPYLQRIPFTQMPITDQWEINRYMMNLLKDRFDIK